MPNPSQKEVIYIDVDDEITAIIDKVRSSAGRIIALVLPKRATVLQSIVNMRLLKRSAEQAKKHIVLITTETGLMPLAGAVGMHVAGSLQSKPIIPETYGAASTAPAGDDDFDVSEVADKPVGQLAGIGAGRPAAVPTANDLETIQLDDEPDQTVDKAAPAPGGVAAAAASDKAAKKDKKLAVPDFNKFRLGLIVGGVLLVGLLVFFYFAAFVLPKATVTIATDSSDIKTNATINLSPTETQIVTEENLLPARIEQKQQTGSQQVSATGQKNKGEKAKGEVTLLAGTCTADPPADVPAGTGVSANGQTFITQENTTFMPRIDGNRKCTFVADDETTVIAQAPGASYNIGPGTFTVAGGSGVTAKSSEAMSGGTDNIVKSVKTEDIESAKQKINATDTNSIKSDLRSKLEAAGYTAIVDSFNGSEPVVTPSAQVGDESDTVTVTQSTTYTMYGVKKSDVRTFILANVNKRIDPKRQKILNDGVSKANFDVSAPVSSGVLTASMSATSLAGPDINTAAIKTAIKGKKTNDVRTYVRSTPGVTDVTVKYSPFWVTKVPNKESKITVLIDKADASTNAQN
ncbi:MAG TPA: hypothetical protein VK983_04330 [Candidatus Limnocylindrales bacterium]|nr:hypothetical protein [Candidatus Limnocylindrales bacterium]